MDEELQKRNTDCVYFLASPLTCKKLYEPSVNTRSWAMFLLSFLKWGIDCEYRHCEIARFNPRDCWYWLSGSCLNPSCAFRHPPLDVHTGPTSEPAPSSVPVNKTNVPCYFYFNGLCNKGNRCCFLHDNNADVPTGEKLAKTTLANSEVPNLENNTFALRDSGSAPSNKLFIQKTSNKMLNPSSTAKAEADTTAQPKEDFRLSVPEDVEQQSGSSPISVSEREETATIRSDSHPLGGFVHSISYACEEHSSEEQEDDRIDPEKRWESSPGFDVLVDDGSENLDSEDDPEYIMALERVRRDLNSHLLGYDFENQVEYDSRYPEMELQYESERYCGYNPPLSKDILGDVGDIPGHAKVRMFDSFLSHKRKMIPMELAFGNHRHVDLRDHLRRRRFIDGHSATALSRMHESGHVISRNNERPWQRGMGCRQPHERSVSDVGRNAIDSPNNRTHSKGGRWHRFPRHLEKHQSRRHYKEKNKEKRFRKRHFLSSEASSKRVPRERRSTQQSASFSGPKTLAQITEGKTKAENDDFTRKMRGHSRKSSVDFRGPKPLSEILKDKGKLTCESEGQTSTI